MKKIFTLAAVLLVMLLCNTSCRFFTDQRPGTDNNNSQETKIYGAGINTTIIIGNGADDKAFEIGDVIYDRVGSMPSYNNDTSEAGGSEIILGESNRELSTLAKTELNKKIRSIVINTPDEEEARKDTVGYAVYIKDGALALVWSSEEIKDMAFEYLVENYLKEDSLDSATPVADVQAFSITEYYDELVYEQRAAEWEKLKEDFISFGCSEAEANDCVKAVQNFYSIFDQNVYLWLANLYDPVNGGFYYSNSGRDTAGFLPDIESTLQALNLLQNRGMFDDFGNSASERLQTALPKEMQEKIVAFVQGCQSDTDGYFHHPQWAGMDSSWTSRLNRDLNWAVSLLSWFGAEPLYSLPTSRPVSGQNLTGKLGNSTAAMVSKVVAVDSADVDFLASPEAFESYLASFDWKTQSYQAANVISSMTLQISSRGYTDIYKNFIYGIQNPENGLFEDGVYYASVNGLMKTTATFNSLGIKFNYAEEAFESAIAMAKFIGNDEEGFPANHIVDVYNPWYAISDILINAEKYGDHGTVDKLREILASEAEELIVRSLEKTSPFKKEDGSFGYNWDYSPDKSQGAPVAVPGSVEGDVNGCVMCFGVIGNLLSAFGIEGPRHFYINDYRAFIKEIEGLGPVIKSNKGVPAEVITFDDEEIGNTEPNDFSSVSVGTGSAQVELREGSEEDKVFHLIDNSHTTGTSIRITPGGVPMGASRCVLEFDINVAKSSDGVIYQLFMGSTYILTLTSQGETIRIGDSSRNGIDNDLGVSFNKGEWHKIRVEYFYTGVAETTVTKIFLDGALRTESTNFYGKKPSGDSKPELSYPEVHFYTLYDPTVDVYLDNLFAEKDNALYVSEPIFNPNRVTDFEDYESSTLTGEMNGALHGGNGVIEVIDNPYPSEASDASGKLLHFASSNGMASFSKRIESLVSDGNAYVFEADIYIANASEQGAITQMYFEHTKGKIFALTLAPGNDAGGRYVDLSILNTKNNTAKTALARIYLGNWVKLRIEYYKYQYKVGPDGNLWDGVKVRVLLDGEEAFNGLCEYPDPNSLSKPATNFYNYILAGKSLDMYIDNIVFELANITYIDENGNEVPDPENPAFPSGGAPTDTPAENDHDGKFDFDNSEPGTPVVSGLATAPNTGEYGNNIEIAEDSDGNKALKFTTVPSEKNINSATFTASKLSPSNADCQIVEFSILAERAAGNENYLQLYMFDSSGKNVTSYNILFPKDLNGQISISTRFSSSTPNGAEATVDFTEGYIKFRFEYYESIGITKIYINDTFVTEGAGRYGGNNAVKTEYFKLTTLLASEFVFYIDNVTVESVKKDYKAN